jgi:hypothetical protein
MCLGTSRRVTLYYVTAWATQRVGQTVAKASTKASQSRSVARHSSATLSRRTGRQRPMPFSLVAPSLATRSPQWWTHVTVSPTLPKSPFLSVRLNSNPLQRFRRLVGGHFRARSSIPYRTEVPKVLTVWKKALVWCALCLGNGRHSLVSSRATAQWGTIPPVGGEICTEAVAFPAVCYFGYRSCALCMNTFYSAFFHCTVSVKASYFAFLHCAVCVQTRAERQYWLKPSVYYMDGYCSSRLHS